MNILLIGDVFGRPGRKAIQAVLPGLRQRESIDLVIVNGENAAGGKGLTPGVAQELFAAGCHAITGGNHSFANREVLAIANSERRLLRPANFPDDPEIPGAGWGVFTSDAGFPVGVLNLCGRVGIGHFDCPFRTATHLLPEIQKQTRVIVVDFHAEATSEKVAMGWYLDGKVSAVLGTHTHIMTADERVLPGGTAYITDVGMTGPYDSVIGVRKELALESMMTLMKNRFEPASGDVRLCAVLVEVDGMSGRAAAIRRIVIPVE